MAVLNVAPKSKATQWTGANVIEVRQVVRAGLGAFNDAIIDGGVLYIFVTPPAGGVEPGMPPFPRIEVPVGFWLVSGDPFNPLSDADFTARYTVVP